METHGAEVPRVKTPKAKASEAIWLNTAVSKRWKDRLLRVNLVKVNLCVEELRQGDSIHECNIHYKFFL